MGAAGPRLRVWAQPPVKMIRMDASNSQVLRKPSLEDFDLHLSKAAFGVNQLKCTGGASSE